MSLLSKLFGKKAPQSDNLDDEARAKAFETRVMNSELRQKEKELRLKTLELQEQMKQAEIKLKISEMEQKLDELNAENADLCDHGCDENTFCPICDGAETMGEAGFLSEDTKVLLSIFEMIKGKSSQGGVQTAGVNPSQLINQSQTPANASKSLTDEELKGLWSQVTPTYKVVAKGMSDDALRQFLISREPMLDADTVNRAIKIIRSE